jgi:peptidoglycan/LPS O-acetylase OafA/YrhL
MIQPLTSLRFFFALCIFLSHYTIHEKVIFPYGSIGVEFFFILSGFIITYNYEEKLLKKQITKRNFYIARFARIYPLHLATLFLVVLASIMAIMRHGGFFPWKQFICNIVLFQSFIPIREFYFSFNAVSWSISNELFFYMLFPFLVEFIHVCKKQYLYVLGIFLLLLYFAATFFIPEQYHHAVFYINPVFRTVDFIIGIGVFHFWKHIRFGSDKLSRNIHNLVYDRNKFMATLIEISSIAFLVLLMSIAKNIPSAYRYASYYWLPMSLIVFIFAKPNGGGCISLLLSWKPLVIAGEVSFGFYMLHQQAISVTTGVIKKLSKIIPIPANEAGRFIIIFLIIFTASMVSFYCFERPMNKLMKKLFGYGKV